jgi:hypothetical protein
VISYTYGPVMHVRGANRGKLAKATISIVFMIRAFQGGSDGIRVLAHASEPEGRGEAGEKAKTAGNRPILLYRECPSHGRGPRFDPLCAHHAQTYRPSA